MPGLYILKAAGLLMGAACLMALPARAGAADFDRAVETGAWHGCVYEESYSPYPIELTPRGADFFVSYPDLECVGGHSIDAGAHDALETMVIDTGAQCTTGNPLTYTLTGAKLRIDYHGAETGTFALLRAAPPGATPPACSEAEDKS